jgi:thiamine-monophosphate kinase
MPYLPDTLVLDSLTEGSIITPKLELRELYRWDPMFHNCTRGQDLHSEENLIERAVRAIPSLIGAQTRAGQRKAGVALGIGDDAAILSPQPGYETVLSCDAFLEGVHFLRGIHPPDSVGYKALARATSDLAAMGARPTLFFLTIGLPADLTGTWFDQFLQGMGRVARKLGIRLAGGDTSCFSSVTISLTVLGQVEMGRAARRAGARPGHIIYVSGPLGRAELGLAIMRALPRGAAAANRHVRDASSLLQPHLYPRIRLELGAWLARSGVASAMMDLSDGLSTDLPRLCHASGVGARLWLDRVPRVQIPSNAAKWLGARGAKLGPIAMALNGGDDYELLFTVARRKVAQLKRAPDFSELRAIGEVVPKREGIAAIDSSGDEKPLRAKGWDSFRKK